MSYDKRQRRVAEAAAKWTTHEWIWATVHAADLDDALTAVLGNAYPEWQAYRQKSHQQEQPAQEASEGAPRRGPPLERPILIGTTSAAPPARAYFVH